jgi:hypothetical protein
MHAVMFQDGKLFLWLEFADEVIDIMWKLLHIDDIKS